MKYACQYAIVRFMPFVETGEFANVGVILMCPEISYFNFQLLRRVRRITAFFDQLEARIYREAKNDLRSELLQLKQYVEQMGPGSGKAAKYLFQELIRPREVMLRFDAAGVVLTNDPTQKLEELFNFYVERDFVTPEYIERRLEHRVKNILEEIRVKDFYHEARVESGAFHARFPFARKNEEGNILKVIKPLHLAHKDPSNAYDHGWAWVGKIKQLQKHGALPEKVLIAAQAPAQDNEKAFAVYDEIKADFERLHVDFLPLSEERKIKKFVLEA